MPHSVKRVRNTVRSPSPVRKQKSFLSIIARILGIIGLGLGAGGFAAYFQAGAFTSMPSQSLIVMVSVCCGVGIMLLL